MGCIGGRKVTAAGAGAGGAMGDDGFQAREPMIFKDITVSRKHFEVSGCHINLCSLYHLHYTTLA